MPVTWQGACRGSEAAIRHSSAHGIYHVGDDQPITIQEFLDGLCAGWRCRRPWRVSMWSVQAGAAACERFARVAGTTAPLT